MEIASWLDEGVNTLAVEVLRYPLAHRSGNFGMVRTATPGLFVEGGIVADGNQRSLLPWRFVPQTHSVFE